MICQCHCGRVYWKYSGAQPAGFCSWRCWWDRDKRARPARELNPEEPHQVLDEIREHNYQQHHVISVTYQAPGCEACEHLEARYAEALHNVRVA
jgi:hypothetical protein